MNPSSSPSTIAPSIGAPSIDPSDAPSVTPSTDIYMIDAQSVTPSTDAPSVTPLTSAPSVDHDQPPNVTLSTIIPSTFSVIHPDPLSIIITVISSIITLYFLYHLPYPPLQ